MDKLEITDSTVFQRVYSPREIPDGFLSTRRAMYGMWHENIGLLLVGVSKDEVKRGDFITNCPRMKKAIELCGGTCYSVGQIGGIERWCFA